MRFKIINFSSSPVLGTTLGLVLLACAVASFWVMKLVFAKSLLLGLLFVFFVLPVALRCFLGLLMLALPLFLSPFGFSAQNRQKRQDGSIDVPFKVLD